MSEKVTQALDIIKGMSLMEAAELKKALEDESGVTAAAPMMMAGPMAGGGEAARAHGAPGVDPELSLQDAVHPSYLLLLTKLNAIFRLLEAAARTMLPWRI